MSYEINLSLRRPFRRNFKVGSICCIPFAGIHDIISFDLTEARTDCVFEVRLLPSFGELMHHYHEFEPIDVDDIEDKKKKDGSGRWGKDRKLGYYSDASPSSSTGR